MQTGMQRPIDLVAEYKSNSVDMSLIVEAATQDSKIPTANVAKAEDASFLQIRSHHGIPIVYLGGHQVCASPFAP